MHEHWDVVIVGSGPGGLTAGACLAASGQRVLVLERHDVAGGNAQVFRRHHRTEAAKTEAADAVVSDDSERDEYEFDVGVHYIGDCGPGGLFPTIFGALGLAERMSFRPLDPDGFDTLHFPDLTLRVPADWDTYRARVAEAFPDERAGVERCLTVLQGVAEESRARLIPGADTPTFDEWAFRPLSELFDQAELSQRAQAVIDHWSGLYAGPPKDTAVAMHAGIIDHYMRGAAYPEGGGQAIPARLIQVIESFGGEVRCLSPVEQILVDERRAQGVRLADGTVIDAPVVISNADHTRTVTELVDRTQWDPATVSWTESARMTLGLVCVYVVVDIDLPGPNTNYFVFPNYETDALYDTLDDGTMPEGTAFAYVAMASRKDPDNPHLCPPGHTNFQIMTLAPRGNDWWGLDDESVRGTGQQRGASYRRSDAYRARKQQLTDQLIDAAETVLGPFRDHIVHVETATPLSHARYTGSTGGTSYGYVHSPDQTGDQRPQHRTEIDGLWLVGANTASGHGIAGTMAGGVNCAGQILDRPLLVEMFMGTKLAGADQITSDEPDIDLLEYCRGERLRTQRAQGRAARAATKR